MATLQLRTSKLPHLAGLDGLRGVAVLLVVWLHMPPVTGVAPLQWSARFAHVVNAGYLGVDLFFVLSGFLITRLLLHERAASGRINYGRFYIKRAFRIFPIYYVTLLATLPFIDPGADFTLLNVLFLQNYYSLIGDFPSPIEHTWSLAVEEQFYCLWPWAMAGLPVSAGRWLTGYGIPALSVAAAALIIAAVPHGAAQGLLYTATPVRMIALSLGAYLAYRDRAQDPLPVGRAALIGLAGIAVLFGVDGLRMAGLLGGGDYYRTFANAGLSLLSAAMVAGVLAPHPGWTGPVRSILASRSLRYVGKISYGLYLYHYVVMSSLGMIHLEDEGTRAFLPVFGALAASFGLAAASYAWLEAPVMRWGRRLLIAQPEPQVAEAA